MLIGASAVSQVGDWLYNAALLAYVFSATHSAVWVGAATICRLLPYVLLGPLGGAIADRLSPPHGVGGGKPAAPRDHARTGGGGRWPWPGCADDRNRRRGIGGGERGAAGSVVAAPAPGGRGSDRSRQRVASHRAGPRRRHRSGDWRAPARRRVGAGCLPRQRSNVRRRGAAVLDARRSHGPHDREPRRQGAASRRGCGRPARPGS